MMVKILFFMISCCLINPLFTEKITLASWNILAQEAYKKYVKVNAMPWNDRQDLLEKHLQELAQNVDIICLQECDLRNFLTQNNWLLTTMSNVGFTAALPSDTKQRQDLNNSYLVSLVFYNSKKFDATNNYSIDLGKGYYVSTSTTLTFKNNSLPSLKIISLHRPSLKNYALDNIENNLMKHSNKKGFTIICGDFNYPTSKISYPDTSEYAPPPTSLISKKLFDPTQWSEACLKNCNSPTAYSAGGYLEKIDYVFYTRAAMLNAQNYLLTPRTFNQMPSLNVTDLWVNLIKHARPAKSVTYTGPDFTTFPSDHALLLVEFDLVKDTALDDFAQALFSIAT